MKDKILALLLDSGWNSSYIWPTEVIETMIKNRGYPLLSEPISFLAKFNKLKIYFYNKRNKIEKDDITIDFDEAADLETIERVNDNYKKRINSELVLIGTAYRDHFVLLMDSGGKVYGGFDNFLCKIADTGLDAIEAIVEDYPFEEIP